LGPNTSFVVAIFGICAIYIEFIRPGRIFPGVLGTAALVLGSYSLWRNSPSPLGLGLIGTATVLFMIEAFLPVYGIAGLIGTAVLAIGACKLFLQPPSIVRSIAISLSIIFGGVTTFLAHAAKRARRNKRSDLLQ